MDALIAATGFKGSFAEFSTFLRTDPRFFYDKPEDLLAGYRDIAKRIDPELVKLFGKLPRLPYGVRPVPVVRREVADHRLLRARLARRRPARLLLRQHLRPEVAAEVGDGGARPRTRRCPAITCRSRWPQELAELPEWRKYDVYTAFVEGWGLYAESLGDEIGLYKDPYSKFGQLTYEMWRAIRLVVDTGMHAMGWTRQQAIDYFKANSGKAEHDIEVEVDRYIVWPGQALAYKIGELKIKELRAYAEKELGAKFDVRAFHDQVLGNGALPLDVLEKNVKAWVAEVKSGEGAKAAR